MAPGDDVCPEPNDDRQAACYLGPNAEAQAFSSSPDDVDAYRIEVLDLNVGVRVELAERPRPYTIELVDWNGGLLARSKPTSSGSELIQTTVRLPGAYWVLVLSPAGEFSDVEPYVIYRALTYPGQRIPQILYSSEFREGQATGFAGSTAVAEHSEMAGRHVIAMKVAGTPADPRVAARDPGIDRQREIAQRRPPRGPEVHAGFQVFFRRVDSENSYVLTVDARDGKVMLSKWVNDQPTGTDWIRSAAIETGGRVNRCVIRAAGCDVLVSVNGEAVVRATDGTFSSGRFGFGAITWGEAPVVQFDNVLVTTPSAG
ncbi:MAG: hypothetical protein M3O34_14700 [Chloroflexota bacterium]|nr:hypothetical protein [Chloroflexota bacterium]